MSVTPQYDTTGQPVAGTASFGIGTDNYGGFSFTASATGYLSEVEANVTDTSFADYINVSLWSDVNGTPGSEIASLGTFPSVFLFEVGPPPLLAENILLEAGQRYWIESAYAGSAAPFAGPPPGTLGWQSEAGDAGTGTAGEYTNDGPIVTPDSAGAFIARVVEAPPIDGTSGNDTLVGSTSGNNYFDISQGGNDSVTGGASDDMIFAGAALTAADKIDGGAGNNTLSLDGDYYSAGKPVTFRATTIQNIQTITVAGGHSYRLAENDGNVALFQTLTVDGSALSSGDIFSFNGAAEMEGQFNFIGGAGTYNYTGGAGNDTFSMGADFTAADKLNGGGGDDTLSLNGNYSLTFTAATITGISDITLAGGNNYNLTLNKANVGTSPLTIDGSALGSGDGMGINGTAVTGPLDFIGGEGTDTLFGGTGNDVFNMGGNLTGTDDLNGGGGNDTLLLSGGNYTGLRLGSGELRNIDTVSLAAGNSYDLTLGGSDIAAGQTMTIDGSALGTSGFSIFGPTNLTVSAANEATGNLAFLGGAGNDALYMGGSFTAADSMSGGGGNDTLELAGNYKGLVLGASSLTGVSDIQLDSGYSYNLTSNDANVASGRTMTVDGSGLGAGNSLTFDGSAEMDGNFYIYGGAGKDTLKGGGGNDMIDISHGGNDTVSAGGGDDMIVAGAALTAADSIDGGTGNDTLSLAGTYKMTFGATTIQNIETIVLAAGSTYAFSSNDANVGAGQTLTVDGSALGSSDSLSFNGSAEKDGSFVIKGGSGLDTFTGGANADTFIMGANLMASDKINGGGGNDTLTLSGDYSGGLTFGAATITNIANLTLAAGNSYNLTTNNANLATGQTLTVDGSKLGASDSLVFNGSAETSASFVIQGGAGYQTLTGGAGDDTVVAGTGQAAITGGGGADMLVAGSGGDRFVYNSVKDSTSTGYDTIVGFDATEDTFSLPTNVNAVDKTVSGNLSTASFDSDLNAALTAAHMPANTAVLFNATGGTLAGQTFLVIDANGKAGYQANADYVMDLNSATNLSSLAISNFQLAGGK